MDFLNLFRSENISACRRCCGTLELNCFNVPRFLIFILFSVVLPYITYQAVSEKLKWTERKKKTTIDNVGDGLYAAFLQIPLFLIGNQSTCFDWMTIIGVFAGIMLFGFVSESPVLHHSLVSVSAWGPQMYLVMTSLALTILGMTGFHVYLATQVPGPFWKIYITAFLVPITMLGLGWAAVKRQNRDENQPKASIHLHHASIFYALAFFARFPHPISRIAAGLAMGCSLHGIAAYGFDDTFVQN